MEKAAPDPSSSNSLGWQRRIRGWLWLTVPGTYGILGAAYTVLPPLEVRWACVPIIAGAGVYDMFETITRSRQLELRTQE